jgi:hypothetical protein
MQAVHSTAWGVGWWVAWEERVRCMPLSGCVVGLSFGDMDGCQDDPQYKVKKYLVFETILSRLLYGYVCDARRRCDAQRRDVQRRNTQHPSHPADDTTSERST